MSDGSSATPEQKLNIATYFIMSAPTGEIDEVLAGQSHSHTLSQQQTAHNTLNIAST